MLAALIPAVPIVAGFVIGAGSPAAVAQVSSQLSPLSSAAPTARPAGEGLPPGSGALVALIEHPTAMRVAPRSSAPRLAAVTRHTNFGSVQTMWVVKTEPGWLGVITALAGNNRVGWIPASAAELSRVTWKIEVSLAQRRVTVLDNGRVQARFTVAVGRPTAPTPTGRFAVTDRLLTHDPTGPYGCCILALSAVAPHAIQGWNGGNRIAIHSTPEASTIGDDVSHGCVRLTLAEGRWLLDHIPIGTPTLISS